MAWFDGRLYVGTTAHSLALTRAAPTASPPQLDPWPVRVPEDIHSLDLRAAICRYTPEEDRWEQVYVSPVIAGRKGQSVPRDLGYRGMAVAQGPGESRPSLYIGAGASATRGLGAVILRTEDGREFRTVGEPGMGDPDVASYRAMTSFRGRVYTSPAGSGKAWNVAARPSVFELAVPAAGTRVEASLPGFGEPDNLAIFDLGVAHGRLYAGTGNVKAGYQVWWTDGEGTPPYRWAKILDRGAWRGPMNEGVTSMCAHGEALYVGGGIQHGGYDRNFGVGPGAAEVVRVFPDGTFDIVCGGARDTPGGFKTPLSRRGPGFDNFFVGYIWAMAAWGGRIYAGTFDSSTFLRWASGDKITAWLRGLSREAILEREAGFDLWSSADGASWDLITRTGFGNFYNDGSRTLVASPAALYVGTANPFAPDVAMLQKDGTWRYEPNPDGGCEIWMGRPD